MTEEIIGPATVTEVIAHWRNAVLDYYSSKCSNCGADRWLTVRMIVPREAGGQYVVNNGVVLCRACEIAAKAINSTIDSGERRPVNIWISNRLYASLRGALDNHKGFGSMSSLIRALMKMLVEDPARFDDLSNYQDSGSDAKINIWVDCKEYENFKAIAKERSLTVTDAIKALILMYSSTVLSTLEKKNA